MLYTVDTMLERYMLPYSEYEWIAGPGDDSPVVYLLVDFEHYSAVGLHGEQDMMPLPRPCRAPAYRFPMRRCRFVGLHGQQVGMLAARRTGNMALDMAIAVSIPLLMEACTEGWRRARPLLWELLCQTFSSQRRKERFYRCIEFERVRMRS